MASAEVKKITWKTVEAAVSDAANGKQYDLTDPQCPGLQLRVRGGAVSWAVRARLHGTQRRWIVGGPDIKPDAARDRAGEVKAGAGEPWILKSSSPNSRPEYRSPIRSASAGSALPVLVLAQGRRRIHGPYRGVQDAGDVRRLCRYAGRQAAAETN
jgi:hypothetical protein